MPYYEVAVRALAELEGEEEDDYAREWMVFPRLTFAKERSDVLPPQGLFLRTPLRPSHKNKCTFHSLCTADREREGERERETARPAAAFNQSETITCGAVVIAGKAKEERDGVTSTSSSFLMPSVNVPLTRGEDLLTC